MPDNRKLPQLDQVPNWGIIKPMRYQKRLYDMRGPELVHNNLMYNQYGIIVSALCSLAHYNFSFD